MWENSEVHVEGQKTIESKLTYIHNIVEGAILVMFVW